ncbi:MAG: hypothetical protein Q8R82_07305 [Hyphomonadaceae bacterium]|nr:hypothetical protein [Hyphomonadaceae bacterium]
MRAFSSAILGLASVAAATACAPAKTEAPPAAAPVASATTAATPIKLPVSINAIMVALVDHASEPLWLDAYEPPATADRWLEAQYNAYQMAISGKLIQLAGTGPNDADWVTDPDWIKMSDELSAAGMDALQASIMQDAAMLNTAGDRLVAACEACHKQFKPGLTSMGIYKSPNYPEKK